MIIDRPGSGYGYEKQGCGPERHHGGGHSGMSHMMHSEQHQLHKPPMFSHGQHHGHQSGGVGHWPGQNMGGHGHHNNGHMNSGGMFGNNRGMVSAECHESYKVDAMPGREYEDMRVECRSYGPNGRYYQYDEAAGSRRDGFNTSDWGSKGV